jgi:hypothetical protein
LRVWLWQALPGDEVHDGRLPRGQPERSQGHVPVQKATLVDQPEDFGGGNALVCPVRWPVVKDVLRNVPGRLRRVKLEVFGLPADEDQAEVDD